MAFSWQKVLENSPVTQQAKVQAQIDATNAATKAIRDQIAANDAAELAGKVSQTNTKATGSAQTDSLISGSQALSNDQAELDGLVSQSNAKASGYFQTRTLLSGAFTDEEAHSTAKSNVDPFLTSGSEAQVRAKRRTTLLAG